MTKTEAKAVRTLLWWLTAKPSEFRPHDHEVQQDVLWLVSRMGLALGSKHSLFSASVIDRWPQIQREWKEKDKFRCSASIPDP